MNSYSVQVIPHWLYFVPACFTTRVLAVHKLFKEKHIIESCASIMKKTNISAILFALKQSVLGLENNNRVSFTFAGIWRLMHSNGLSSLSILKSHSSLWKVDINQRERSLTPALESGH